MVSLKPCFSVTLVFDLRNASRSVISASSNCVTCGIETQLRCRLAPESFWMRDSGFVSTGPNFAKSTSGQAGKLNGSAPPRGAARCEAGPGAPPCAMTPLTKACTSSCSTRPFGPLPRTWARSTPSSRANLRTDGLACAFVAAASCGSAGTGSRRGSVI